MDFNNMKDEFTNPQDVSDMFTAEDIEANKVFAALATIPILFWLPLVAAKDSAYGKFYANQGLILLIAGLVIGVIGGILNIIPILGWILSTILSFVPFAGFLFLLVSVLQGKARRLPVVGGLVEFFK